MRQYNLKITIAALAAALMCLLTVMTGTSYSYAAAAAQDTDAVYIPFEVMLSGDADTSAVYSFEITGENGAPMPAETNVTISGRSLRRETVTNADGKKETVYIGSAAFGPITCAEPDDYQYTVQQTTASAALRRIRTVDHASYRIIVRVLNRDAAASGARYFVWAKKNGAKPIDAWGKDELIWRNHFRPVPSGHGSREPQPGRNDPSVVHTGDDAHWIQPVAWMMSSLVMFLLLGYISRRRRRSDADQ